MVNCLATGGEYTKGIGRVAAFPFAHLTDDSMRPLRRFIFLAGLTVFLVCASRARTAEPTPAKAQTASVQDFKSPHFLIHTDLSPKEAQVLLEKLETMLSLISRYWGRPCNGVIECYVAKDLAVWPANSLDPDGRAKIAAGGGVTMTQVLMRGNQTVAAKSVVYATSLRGTTQHEAVHAYCGQTFGNTGPVWYAEGMAEMGQYWKQNDSAVNCDPYVVEHLRANEPKSLNDIINSNERTGDSWQNYAWRWALCHLLANNLNYRDRFRPLGLGLLTEQPVNFEQTYGAMADEISFEYRFFLENVELGYRVDLCSWDWKRKFLGLSGTATLTANIQAGRGWQPSGVSVSKGQSYDYVATGKWKTGPDASDVTAVGDSSGKGRLIGVVMQDFKLSEPFELAERGSFTPPGDGKLYLRCREDLHQIADNKGVVAVKFKLSEAR